MVKVFSNYTTKQRIKINEVVSQWVDKDDWLEVVAIYRHPDGWNGRQRNRYKYEAVCVAPDDADFADDGYVRCNVWRKLNPHFDPKKIEFIGDKWIAPKD